MTASGGGLHGDIGAGAERLFDRHKHAHVGQTLAAIRLGLLTRRDAIRELGDLAREVIHRRKVGHRNL